MLIYSERASVCSELNPTQEASSRVSCHQCFELHHGFADETSDMNFAHCTKIFSIRSSQCDIRGLQTPPSWSLFQRDHCLTQSFWAQGQRCSASLGANTWLGSSSIRKTARTIRARSYHCPRRVLCRARDCIQSSRTTIAVAALSGTHSTEVRAGHSSRTVVPYATTCWYMKSVHPDRWTMALAMYAHASPEYATLFS